MQQPQPLLNQTEVEDFQRPSRVKRNVSFLSEPRRKPQTLFEVVAPAVRDLLRDTDARAREPFCLCYCVDVEPDDGMTWAAEAFRRDFAKAFPQFKQWILRGDREYFGSSQIATVFKIDRFLKIAVKHRLVEPYREIFSPLTLWLLFGAAAVAGVGKILDLLLKGNINFAQVAVYSVLSALATLIVTIVSKTPRLNRTKKEAEDQLAEFLGSRSSTLDPSQSGLAKSRTLQDFTAEISREISIGQFPRLLIIDNNERLDVFTRSVLGNYWGNLDKIDLHGSEVWIVFQHPKGAQFGPVLDRRRLSNKPGERKRLVPERLVQCLLSDSEIASLAADVRPGDAYALDRRVVKHLFGSDADAIKRFHESFEQARMQFPLKPDHYSPLDLFYICACTCKETNFYLNTYQVALDFSSQRNISRRLSTTKAERLGDEQAIPPEEQSIRYKTLTSLLRGLQVPHALEIDGRLREARQAFSSAIRYRDGEKAFRVTFPAASALQDLAGKLDLPAIGLVHVFWVLFWCDKLERHPVESFWVRKLYSHLSAADITTVANDLFKATGSRFLDAYLYTLQGAVRTNLFEDVREHMQTLPRLVRSISPTKIQYGELVSGLWKAFMLFGGTEILEVIGEMVPAEAPRRRDMLAVVYQSFLSKESATASRLADSLRRNSPEAADLARANGMWILATLIRPGFVLFDSRKMDQSEWLGAANRIVSRAETRLRDGGYGSGVQDCIGMSYAIWALTVGLARTARRASRSPYQEALEFVPQMLALSDRALSVVDSYRKQFSSIGIARDGTDYVLYETLADLALTVQAALTLTTSMLDLRSMDIKITDNYARIVTRAVQLSSQNPATPLDLASLTTPKHLDNVDRQLSRSVAIWQTLGMNHLKEVAIIRRAQFFRIRHLDATLTYSDVQSIAESVAAVSDQSSSEDPNKVSEAVDLEILASLTLVDLFSGMSELTAFYAQKLYDRVRDFSLPEWLLAEFRWSVIYRSAQNGRHLDRFVQPFLANDDPDLTFEALLDRHKGRPRSVVFGLLQTALSVSSPKLRDHIFSLLDRWLLSQNGGTDDESLPSLLSAFRWHAKMLEGVADLEEMIDEWRSRRTYDLYAGLLSIALVNHLSSPRLLDEIHFALSVQETEQSSDGRFRLAGIAAQRFFARENGGVRRLAMDYLDRNVEKWEALNSADVNVTIFQILGTLGSNRGVHFRTKAIEWQKIKIVIDHLRSYPEFAAKGRFLLIFIEYFESMRIYNIPIDISTDDFVSRYWASAVERQDAIEEFVANQRRVPSPISKDGSCVSAEFLCLGKYLVSPPFSVSAEFSADRTAFDKAARSNLKPLVEIIKSLPELPAELRDLLSIEAQKLEYFTEPQPLEDLVLAAGDDQESES